MTGSPADPRCCQRGVLFSNLDDLVDDCLLTPASPDLYYGSRPTTLDRVVRARLAPYIVPSTDHSYPLAPNFFLEIKGPSGNNKVALHQACYNGAIGARAMLSLSSYGRLLPVYDNMAYAISCTLVWKTLTIYTTHAAAAADADADADTADADTPPSDTAPPNTPPASDSQTRPQYFTSQLCSFALDHDLATCRKAIETLRNAIDFAEEERLKVIEKANSVALAVAVAVSDPPSSPASVVSSHS
jgi:hypothetical protein